jgi:hypothetical protein
MRSGAGTATEYFANMKPKWRRALSRRASNIDSKNLLHSSDANTRFSLHLGGRKQPHG